MKKIPFMMNGMYKIVTINAAKNYRWLNNIYLELTIAK
jgi:hypothetical protein